MVRLTPKQRRSVNRIIRFYRSRARIIGESLRIKLDPTSYGAVWISLETRRAGYYLGICPRTHIWAHIQIGQRGGIKVWSAYCQTSQDESRHVAHCLRGQRARKK